MDSYILDIGIKKYRVNKPNGEENVLEISHVALLSTVSEQVAKDIMRILQEHGYAVRQVAPTPAQQEEKSRLWNRK